MRAVGLEVNHAVAYLIAAVVADLDQVSERRAVEVPVPRPIVPALSGSRCAYLMLRSAARTPVRQHSITSVPYLCGRRLVHA